MSLVALYILPMMLGAMVLRPAETAAFALVCSYLRSRFEVSGSAAGILAATKHAAVRGRVVVVAIFPEPKPVALFDLFWKELELRGARVYEPEDFDAAIELIGSGSLDLERLVTAVEPLERVPEVFEELRSGRSAMKILVDCKS